MGRTLRALRASTLGVVMVGLAGCWPVPGANPDRTSHNPFETTLTGATVADLTERWRWTSPTGDPSDPVTSTGGVHVTDGIEQAGGCGRLVTLDPATGATVWQASYDDILGCPAASNQSVSEPWVIDIDGRQTVTASAGLQYQMPASLIFIRDNQTRSFDPATGEQVAAGFGYIGSARDGDVLDSFVGLTQRVLPMRMVSVDGRSFVLGFGSPPETSVTLGTDLVYVGRGGMLAIEPGPFTTGFGVLAYSRTEPRPGCGPLPAPPFAGLVPELVECPVWATPTDGATTRPVLDAASGTLFSRSDAGTLYALDPATGAIRWTASGLGAGGAPAVDGNAVWVPTGDGRVLPFPRSGCGAATCAPSLPWHVDTGTGAPVTAVAVAADVVYATSGGAVHAASDCAGGACPVLWSGPGTGAPVVADGRLHIRDGADLVAYALP